MVKRIFFGALFLILLMQVSFAENTTLIDSYSYDYLANGTTVTILDQIDTNERTTISFELNTTPGEVEISSVLGIVSTEQKLFAEENNIITLDFNKITSGEKELLIMIYNEDSLVAFITNYHILIDNNVELNAIPNSVVTINNMLYVTFDVETNMQIENSSAKIVSKKGTLYESTNTITENNIITYTFAPKENSEYNLYEINVNGYVQEFNASLGTFDLSPIGNFKESKVEEGLKISFSSDCPACEKEITLLSEEDEYVYNEKINSDSLIVPSDIIFAMEINGPYKVIINYENIDYEYMTQSYTYGEFETITEEVVEEKTPEKEDSSSSSSDKTIETVEETPVNETIEENTTEETSAVETDVVETNVTETEEDTVAAETTSDKPKDNLITGFSISNIKEFANGQKTMIWSGLAILIVLTVLIFMYLRQRKDAYLYEM